MIGEPAQFGRRDRGNRHHPDAVRPLLGAQFGDEVCGRLGRPSVVPQQCISHHSARAVEAHHAVLLRADGHRRDIVEAARGSNGRLQGRPPLLRIDLGAVRVRRGCRADDRAGVRIADDDLAGLGG